MPKILFVANLSEDINSLADINLIKHISKSFEVFLVNYNKNKVTKELESTGIKSVYYPFKGKFDKKGKALLRSILNANNIDIIQALTTPAIAAAAAVKPKGTILVGYRGAFRHYWYDPFNYFANYHPKVDAIWCISKSVKKHIEANLLFFKKEVFCIYKGIDSSWYKNHEKLDVPLNVAPDNLIITTISNFRKVKGLDYLLMAINDLNPELPIKVFIIGRGNSQSRLTQLVKDQRLIDKIELLGYRSDAFAILKKTDIYVQPSLKEGLGKAIMESMLAHCAPVVTMSGGPEELVEDLKSGLIVEKANSNSLKDAIEKLILDRELLKRLKKAAFERVMQDFNIHYFTDIMEDKYFEILNHKQ